MKKSILIEKLQSELERTYHNATLKSKLTCDSDYECDLVEEQVRFECKDAIQNIRYEFPAILNYGKVYTWGRGGRTLCPEGLIIQRGGCSFRVKSVEDLEMTYHELRTLLKVLTEFNDKVESFCNTVTDSAIEFIREEYAEQIEKNKNKRRQHFSGVRYV